MSLDMDLKKKELFAKDVLTLSEMVQLSDLGPSTFMRICGHMGRPGSVEDEMLEINRYVDGKGWTSRFYTWEKDPQNERIYTFHEEVQKYIGGNSQPEPECPQNLGYR